MLVPVIAQIQRHDRNLAQRLRDAATSMALNAGEASGNHGGTRKERYRSALGSARETGRNLDAAMALGYVDRIDPVLLDRLDHVRAVLFKNTR
jgi:four helix bundle protein